MSTFSLYNSTTYESTSWKLSGTPSYFEYILDTLPDNLQKLIDPRELRDMTLSLWSDVVFKETVASGSSINYVGIDTGNPYNSDIKNKIYFGKRNFSTTPIMTTSSLSSDLDIFLYNTKSDLVDNDTTRISILSGDNFNNFPSMPYFQSQFVTGLSNSLSLDFFNSLGDIIIKNDLGDIKIGGLSGSTTVDYSFPTPSESSASASNNRVLKYDELAKKLYWDDIVYPTTNFIGTTGSPLNIFGNTFVNDFSLELTDNRKVPIQIGDINYGATFSNLPLSEVLKRMIYDYVKPTCSINLTPPYLSGFVEVGTYPSPTLEFTINKRTLPTLPTVLTNMVPGVYSAITNPQYLTVTSSSTGIVISPITQSTSTFSITVNDGLNTATSSTSITGVYPYFWGFSGLSSMTTTGLGSLIKKIEPQSDKIYDISGSGNLYFIYPKIYGTLSTIFDYNGNNCSASFSVSSQILSSPTGLWASEEFWIYQWSGVSQIGPPSQNFEFRY